MERVFARLGGGPIIFFVLSRYKYGLHHAIADFIAQVIGHGVFGQVIHKRHHALNFCVMIYLCKIIIGVTRNSDKLVLSSAQYTSIIVFYSVSYGTYRDA